MPVWPSSGPLYGPCLAWQWPSQVNINIHKRHAHLVLGIAMWMRFRTSPMRLPATFISTRKLSSRSQAICTRNKKSVLCLCAQLNRRERLGRSLCMSVTVCECWLGRRSSSSRSLASRFTRLRLNSKITGNTRTRSCPKPAIRPVTELGR